MPTATDIAQIRRPSDTPDDIYYQLTGEGCTDEPAPLYMLILEVLQWN